MHCHHPCRPCHGRNHRGMPPAREQLQRQQQTVTDQPELIMMFCPDAYLGAGDCSAADMCCMQRETMQECCTLCSAAPGLQTHSAGPPLKRGLCWPAMAHQSQNTWFMQPDERCLVSQPLALQVADAAACCLCQKPRCVRR